MQQSPRRAGTEGAVQASALAIRVTPSFPRRKHNKIAVDTKPGPGLTEILLLPFFFFKGKLEMSVRHAA